MVKRSKGLRSKTRSKFRVRPRDRGKSKITTALQSFDNGEKAGVVIDPRVQKGHPHPRFQGVTGTIVGKQGQSFLLEIRDGSKEKTLVVRPEHLKKC